MSKGNGKGKIVHILFDGSEVIQNFNLNFLTKLEQVWLNWEHNIHFVMQAKMSTPLFCSSKAKEGKVSVDLLTAKAKGASIKKLTIPHQYLLLVALIGSRLFKIKKEDLGLEVNCFS